MYKDYLRIRLGLGVVFMLLGYTPPDRSLFHADTLLKPRGPSINDVCKMLAISLPLPALCLNRYSVVIHFRTPPSMFCRRVIYGWPHGGFSLWLSLCLCRSWGLNMHDWTPPLHLFLHCCASLTCNY